MGRRTGCAGACRSATSHRCCASLRRSHVRCRRRWYGTRDGGTGDERQSCRRRRACRQAVRRRSPGGRGDRRREPVRAPGRVGLHHGSERLRKKHAAQSDRRARYARPRPRRRRRTRPLPTLRQRPQPLAAAPHRLRLSELPSPAHVHGGGERGLAARAARHEGPCCARSGTCRPAPHRPPRRGAAAPSGRALRRRATARSHCARTGHRTAAAAGGRAHREPRHAHRRGGADAAARAQRRARPDRDHGHSQYVRSDVRRSHDRTARRTDRLRCQRRRPRGTSSRCAAEPATVERNQVDACAEC